MMQLVIAGKDPSLLEEYLIKSGHKVKSFYVNDICLDIARAFNPEVFIYMDDVIAKIPHEQALKQIQHYRVLIIATRENPVIPYAAALGIKDFVFQPCELETVLNRIEHPATAGEAAELLRQAPQIFSEKTEPVKKTKPRPKKTEISIPKEKETRASFSLRLPEFDISKLIDFTKAKKIIKVIKETKILTRKKIKRTEPIILALPSPENERTDVTATKSSSFFKTKKAGILLNGQFIDKDKTPLEMLDEKCDAVVIPADWGIKVIRDFRRDPRSKITPLIVLNGNSECIAAGADLYIKKLNQKTIDDITALSSRLRNLWASIEVDALTGIYSRKFLNTWLEERVRQKAPFSVVMLDLDRFKTVNDTYGHEAGDIVLSSFGQFIKQQTRDVDVAGRYGGEEFLICLPYTSENEGFVLINRLREKWSERKISIDNEKNIQCTFSAGVAQWQEGIDVVAMADKQLYLAKEKGRNQVQKATSNPKVLLLGQDLSLQTTAVRKHGLDVTIDPNEASIVICDTQSIEYAPKNLSLYILGKGTVVDWAANKLRPDADILYSIDEICTKILGVEDFASIEEKDNIATSKVPNLSVLPGVRSGAKAQSIPLHGALYVVCPSKPGEASEMAAKLCQTIEGAALICAAPESTAGVILKIPQEKLITSDWRFLGAEAPIRWAGTTIWPVDPYKHSSVVRIDEIQTLIDQIKSRFEITIIDCGARLDLCSRVAGDEGIIIIYTDGDSSDLVAQQWLKNCSTGKVISMSPAETPHIVVGDNGLIVNSSGRDVEQKGVFGEL